MTMIWPIGSRVKLRPDLSVSIARWDRIDVVGEVIAHVEVGMKSTDVRVRFGPDDTCTHPSAFFIDEDEDTRRPIKVWWES